LRRLVNVLNASVTSSLVLALAACSGGGSSGPTPTSPFSAAPSSTPSASPTSTASAKATPTVAPTTTPTTAPTTTPTTSPTATPTPSGGSFTPDDWPLFDHDSARTGTSNEVSGAHATIALNKLWQMKLGDVADTGPIVVGSMLFVTSHDGATYGISTATGAKVWTFTTTGPNITTSTPAYDVTSNTLYAGGVDGRVHRLNPATGAEEMTNGFPVLVTLATQTEKDASPLNIANGYVYAQTSAYDGDGTPYVGHVVAISTSTGQSRVFNTLCSSQTALIMPQSCPEQRSGMWSRSGVVVDPDSTMGGRVYVATGNGTDNPSAGYYGDSVLSLAPDASSLLGNYAPTNAAMLDADDLDLGSTSPVMLPRQSGSLTPLLAVQGGKDAILRLLDRTNLGGANALLQSITMNHGLYSAPAVYLTPSGLTYVYVGLPSGVYAYQLTTMGNTPQLMPAWTAAVSLGGSGTSPVVRNGVVYVAASNQLVALDATTGTMLASNSALGSVHWESPSIANGVVYCTDQGGNLTAFAITSNGLPASRIRNVR
jgi:outer membrane protein assembly factor BamB